MQGISWESLPKTFQDAILMTRGLEVRFLWIDSLCIIQDSREDWARESSKMADIYQNSYLTLAATGAEDSRIGLFNDAPRQPTLTLEGSSPSGKNYSIHFKCVAPHSTTQDPNTPNTAIKHPISGNDNVPLRRNFPLLTRGWVFQERILSPRFLQFGKDELLWDCREASTCECGRRLNDLVGSQYSIDGSQELLAHKWRNMVELFCALNLTYPSDALPALSGIAKRMAERRSGATYLAGIWSDSLALDLLWIARGQARQRIKPSRGPSWAWSSMTGRTIFPAIWRASEPEPSVRVLETYFKFDGAYCTPSTVDVTGEVEDGRLSLEAPMFQLTSLSHEKDEIVVKYNNNSFHGGNDQDKDASSWSWYLLFVPHPKRLFLDDPAEALQLDNKLLGCRISKIEILDDSKFFLIPGARETVQIEFSLLLEQIDPLKNVFRRVGLLADGRIIAGHQGNPNSWIEEKSCFEEGGAVVKAVLV